MLLAQLAADKVAADRQASNASQDVFAWYNKYVEVLKNIGWVLTDAELDFKDADNSVVSLHTAIIPVLTAMLGPMAALPMVISVLRGLEQMDKNSPWRRLGEHRRRIRKRSPQWVRRGAWLAPMAAAAVPVVRAVGGAGLVGVAAAAADRRRTAGTGSTTARGSIPAEQDREKALRAELAELTKARDERLALCEPIAPPPAPVAPPEPPKVTELAPPPPLPKPRPARP